MPMNFIRLPRELEYLRAPARTHGIFVTVNDREDYACALPRGIVGELADIASQIMAQRHFSPIVRFVEQPRAPYQFIGYENRVSDFVGLMRNLYELGDARFGLSPHFDFNVGRQTTSSAKAADEASTEFVSSLGLGEAYKPWLLGAAVNDFDRLCSVVCDPGNPWERRRDATVILRSWPAESASEARALVNRLLACIEPSASAPIAKALWSRCATLAKALGQESDWPSTDGEEDWNLIRQLAREMLARQRAE